VLEEDNLSYFNKAKVQFIFYYTCIMIGGNKAISSNAKCVSLATGSFLLFLAIAVPIGCDAKQLKASRLILRHSLSNGRCCSSSLPSNDDRLLYLLRGGGDDQYYSGGGGGRYDYYEEERYGNRYNDQRSRTGNYYDGDESYNNDREEYESYRESRRKSPSGKGFSIPMANYTNRKVGLPMVALGGFTMMAGIASFFNKFLLRLSHILICVGAPLIFGPGRVAGYFLNPKKSRATITFGAGLFLVMVGHPFLGMILEVFGFLNLFGNMFPLLKVMLRTVPGIGNLFDRSADNDRRKRARSYQDDYQDDGGYYNGDGSAEQYY